MAWYGQRKVSWIRGNTSTDNFQNFWLAKDLVILSNNTDLAWQFYHYPSQIKSSKFSWLTTCDRRVDVYRWISWHWRGNSWVSTLSTGFCCCQFLSSSLSSPLPSFSPSFCRHHHHHRALDPTIKHVNKTHWFQPKHEAEIWIIKFNTPESTQMCLNKG